MLVEGRTVRDTWEDQDENERVTFKVEARRVGILPYRVTAVILENKSLPIDGGATDAGAEM